MNIRCIIVDDEPLARDGMELLVEEIGFLQLVASCSSALEANAILAKEQVDLIFLDIQMPKVRGIDFLKSLHVKPLVIITTAYSNFALEGYELNVLYTKSSSRNYTTICCNWTFLNILTR